MSSPIGRTILCELRNRILFNCKHIANAIIRREIECICRSRGYEPVIICTPEELIER
jgi:hypothetical protein